MLLAGTFSFSQTFDDDLFEMTRLRSECVERSKCEVSVYPNPSQGLVRIEAPHGAICQVHSSAGTYVGSWTVNENGLALSDLPSGTYIATVTYNQISRIKRLVIL